MEKREKEVQELQALLAKKEDENAALRRQVDWLTQQLRLARGQRFGASGEKTQGVLDPIDQISLFNETEAETDGKKPEPELEQVTYQRRKQTAGDGPVWTACGEGRLRIAGERAGLFRMRQTDLFAALRQELLANEVLHADETTLKVLREDKRKCFVWVYRTSGGTLRPVVLYDYQPSRAGTCASSFLQGFSGLLHTDGYEAYHCKLPPEITAVGCWAHMRRKFTDTLKSLPKDIRERHPACKGLDFCSQLFAPEEEYVRKEFTFQQRYQARLERSKPAAEAFFSWARTEQSSNPAPKTMYGDERFPGRAAGVIQ